MRRFLLALFISGCSDPGDPAEVEYATDWQDLEIDALGPGGFSGADILDMVGLSRNYVATSFGAPLEMNPAATEYLLNNGQDRFTVTLDHDSAQAGVVRSYYPDGTVAVENLSVAIDVSTASADGSIAVTGRVHLATTGLAEDAITWVEVSDSADAPILIGDNPEWLEGAIDAGFPSSRCASYATNAQAATRGVTILGPIESSTLKIGVYWERDEACPGFYAVDAVNLVPEAGS